MPPSISTLPFASLDHLAQYACLYKYWAHHFRFAKWVIEQLVELYVVNHLGKVYITVLINDG